MTSLNEGMLTDALVLAQQQLQSFAQSENFWSVFDSVFGTEYDRAQAEAIQQAWQTSDFSQLPEIQVLDSASMLGIQGGFSAETGKIYINADFLANATAEQITAVLIEEISHSLDSRINTSDTPGDEGELFSALVTRQLLTDNALERIHAENDQRTITVNDANVDVESSSGNYGFLGKQVEYQYVFPNFGSNYSGDPAVPITNAKFIVVEPPEFINNGPLNYTVDVDASQITVTYLTNAAWNGFVDFNGFRITDFSGVVSPITGVTDNSSKVTTTFDANNIYINWRGASFSAGETFVVNVNFGNEAPSGSNKTLTTNEDTTYTFVVPDFGFNDIDGNAFSRVRLTTIPTAGSLTLNGSAVSAGTFVNVSDIIAGNLQFTPAPNSNGNSYTSFTFQVEDNGGTASGGANLDLTPNTITVNVAPVNDAPVGSPTAILATGTEDTTYTINKANLLAGFSDVDGDFLSVKGLTANGIALAADSNGNYVFTPPANFNGPVTLNYNVVDSKGDSVAASQSFAITAVNDAPVVATPIDNQNGKEDTNILFSIPATTFSDIDDASLTLSATFGDGNPLPAWLSFNATTGTFSGTPPQDFNGTLSLKVTATDSGNLSTSSTFDLAIANINDAPTLTGTPSTLTAGTEDTAYTISKAQLLAGFSDVDSSELSITDFATSNGTFVENEDGSFTITGANNYNGAVSVNYKVSDASLSVDASNTFNLAAVNDAPTGSATESLVSGTEDTAYTISKAQLLAGFSDVDSSELSITDFATSNGTFVENEDGSFTITGANNYNGAVSVNYKVSDDSLSVDASNTFNLAAVNDAPTGSASAILAAGAEDTAYTISKAQLLAGFSDVDVDVLSITDFVTSNGTFVENEDGSFTITGANNYNGAVSINYKVSDDSLSVDASNTFDLVAVNDNPDAINDIVTARQSTAKTILVADLLANDGDIEGDALSLTQVQNAQNGTVALDSNGDVVFTANANVATASFEYTLSDGKGGTDIAFVSVLVGMVDDGGNGQDTMNGTAGDDVLNGGNGDDILRGFAGDDKLLGGNGVDNLQGGEGKDWLYGGRGNDLLNGGLGRDTFVLISQNGIDTIQDFTDGADQIGLAEGLTFGQLTVSSSNGNTLIAKNGGDVLAILSGVNSSLITQSDFINAV